jgi:dethiobiotin synthetase
MRFFITGTDTGCGKTAVTSALLLALRARGHRAVGMKPIAAGVGVDGRNEDVDALLAASSPGMPPASVNPCLFAAPTAPHIAAAREGRTVAWETLDAAYRDLVALADAVLVEGVGGWQIPLSNTLELSDLPRRWNLPVLMVVGVRLGALNHALLTAESIAHSGCVMAGWFANVIDPGYIFADETIEALEQRLRAPCLARLTWHHEAPITRLAAGLTNAATALEHWTERQE